MSTTSEALIERLSFNGIFIHYRDIDDDDGRVRVIPIQTWEEYQRIAHVYFEGKFTYEGLKSLFNVIKVVDSEGHVLFEPE